MNKKLWIVLAMTLLLVFSSTAFANGNKIVKKIGATQSNGNGNGNLAGGKVVKVVDLLKKQPGRKVIKVAELENESGSKTILVAELKKKISSKTVLVADLKKKFAPKSGDFHQINGKVLFVEVTKHRNTLSKVAMEFTGRERNYKAIMKTTGIPTGGDRKLMVGTWVAIPKKLVLPQLQSVVGLDPKEILSLQQLVEKQEAELVQLRKQLGEQENGLQKLQGENEREKKESQMLKRDNDKLRLQLKEKEQSSKLQEPTRHQIKKDDVPQAVVADVLSNPLRKLRMPLMLSIFFIIVAVLFIFWYFFRRRRPSGCPR